MRITSKYLHTVLVILIISAISTSCNNRQQKIEKQLQICDSLIYTNPKAGYDSLKFYQHTKFNKKNNAYYALLETISEHKTTNLSASDSLIKIAYNWYKEEYRRKSNRTAQLINNTIRSSLYYGIIRYNINECDSLSFNLLKESQILAETNKISDNHILGLIYNYLGNIISNLGDYEKGVIYSNKSAICFEKTDDYENYIYARISTILSLIVLNRSHEAIASLDFLANYKTDSLPIKYEIYSIISTYHSSKKDYTRALWYRELAYKCLMPHKDSRADLWSLTKYNRELGNKRDAIRYAMILDSAITNSEYFDNYKYLNALSINFYKLGDLEKSIKYKQRAYSQLNNYYSVESKQNYDKYNKIYNDIQNKCAINSSKSANIHIISFSIISLLIILFIICYIIYKKKLNRQQIKIKMLRSMLLRITSNQSEFLNSASSLPIIDEKNIKLLRGFLNDYKKRYQSSIYSIIPGPDKNKDLTQQQKAIEWLNKLNFAEQEIADILLAPRSSISANKVRIKQKKNA
jgi:hypothetical protein